ncbi:MAG: hypothetical protein SGI98_05275, partial [Verrucomicrobiota bacterium]|nr:hypothetical protein [Verrucomicrobiota bacterium]
MTVAAEAALATPTPGVIFAVPDFGGAEGILTRVVSFFGEIKGLTEEAAFGMYPDEGEPGKEIGDVALFPAGGGTGFVAAAGFGGKGIRTVSFFGVGFGAELIPLDGLGIAGTGIGFAGIAIAGIATGLGGNADPEAGVADTKAAGAGAATGATGFGNADGAGTAADTTGAGAGAATGTRGF